MGLLDNIGNKLTSMSDNDKQGLALGLASGFAGMSGNPNAPSIMAGIESQKASLMKRRDIDDAKELADSKLQLQTSRALQLIGDEYPDIAQAIQGRFMTPKEGMAEVMRRRNAPAEKEGELVRQYRLAQNEGYQGNFMEFKTSNARAGADQVNIDARSGSEVGTIPQGYELITDENGNRKLQAIAGGEAAQEEVNVLTRKELQKETTNRTAKIVLQDISRLKTLLKNQSNLNPMTAVTGPIATEIASGFSASARADAEALVRTIGGNIGFDRLQRMRNESKTGGALGAINQQEMQLLQDVMGSLKLNQSEASLQTNLNRLADIYTVIMNKANAYPNASQHGFGASIEPSSSAIPTWNPTGGSNGKGAFE